MRAPQLRWGFKVAVANQVPKDAEQKPKISKLSFYFGRPAQVTAAVIAYLKSLPFTPAVVLMLNDGPEVPFSIHAGIDAAILRAKEAGLEVRVCSWARNDEAYCLAMIEGLSRLYGQYGVAVELDCENEVLSQGSLDGWLRVVAAMRSSEFARKGLGEVWVTSLLPDKQRSPRLAPLVEWVNQTGGGIAFQVYNYRDPQKEWSMKPGNEPGVLIKSYIDRYRALGAKRLEPVLAFFHRAKQGATLHPGYTPSLALYHNVIVANDLGITEFGGWSWAALGDGDGAERKAFLMSGAVRFPGGKVLEAGVDASRSLAEVARGVPGLLLKVGVGTVVLGGAIVGIANRDQILGWLFSRRA